MVTCVLDGDSVEVESADDRQVALVRLANVDAPVSAEGVKCFERELAEYVARGIRAVPSLGGNWRTSLRRGKAAGGCDWGNRGRARQKIAKYPRTSQAISGPFQASCVGKFVQIWLETGKSAGSGRFTRIRRLVAFFGFR